MEAAGNSEHIPRFLDNNWPVMLMIWWSSLIVWFFLLMWRRTKLGIVDEGEVVPGFCWWAIMMITNSNDKNCAGTGTWWRQWSGGSLTRSEMAAVLVLLSSGWVVSILRIKYWGLLVFLKSNVYQHDCDLFLGQVHSNTLSGMFHAVSLESVPYF